MKLTKWIAGAAAMVTLTTVALATEGTLRDKDKDKGEGGGEECEVSIEKIAAPEIKVGDFTDFFIRIKNKGNCELDDLEVVDFAPEDVQFDDAHPEPERVVEGQGNRLERVEWEIDDLDPGETKILHLRVHVLGGPNRTLVNEACVEVDDFSATDREHDEDELCDKSFTRVTTGSGNGASNGALDGPEL